MSSATETPTSAIAAPLDAQAFQRQAIDRSCRGPVLFFFVSSVVWLLVGTAFAMVASIKLHNPWFMAANAWMTFGRVRPAHLNVVTYGWSAMAGIGTMLWMMCRLCRTPLRCPEMLTLAGVLWNAGVAVGTGAVLAGHSTGIEWLEFPTSAAFLLFVALALLGLWGVITFNRRTEAHVYVSQWYLFAALFWFPWLYATVQILILPNMWPVKGVTQASINWWYGHNVLGLWFTPIGLAATYYLIPKVIGRPVHSYWLSILGFWSLALFYGWAGAHHLISGPVPAWLVTVSIVGSMMMFIPVTATAINHHMTLRGHFGALRSSPALRFVVFGAVCYTVVSFQGSLLSLRMFNEPFHFTHSTIAHSHLGMYAFFAMVMFGSMYYIIPRLTGRQWASRRLIHVHFSAAAIGIVAMFVFLTVGGMVQGFEMNQASQPLGRMIGDRGLFSGIVEFFRGFSQQNGAVPFNDALNGGVVQDTRLWLIIRSFTGGLLAVGHLAFAMLVYQNISGRGLHRPDPVQPIEVEG